LFSHIKKHKVLKDEDRAMRKNSNFDFENKNNFLPYELLLFFSLLFFGVIKPLIHSKFGALMLPHLYKVLIVYFIFLKARLFQISESK